MKNIELSIMILFIFFIEQKNQLTQNTFVFFDQSFRFKVLEIIFTKSHAKQC